MNDENVSFENTFHWMIDVDILYFIFVVRMDDL